MTIPDGTAESGFATAERVGSVGSGDMSVPDVAVVEAVSVSLMRPEAALGSIAQAAVDAEVARARATTSTWQQAEIVGSAVRNQMTKKALRMARTTKRVQRRTLMVPSAMVKVIEVSSGAAADQSEPSTTD